MLRVFLFWMVAYLAYRDGVEMSSPCRTVHLPRDSEEVILQEADGGLALHLRQLHVAPTEFYVRDNDGAKRVVSMGQMVIAGIGEFMGLRAELSEGSLSDFLNRCRAIREDYFVAMKNVLTSVGCVRESYPKVLGQ